MQYRHIIWDWNGTLMNDAWLCVEVMNDMLARRGMRTVDINTYRQHFGFPVKDYYDWLGFDPSADSFEAISHEYIDAYNARRFECRLHPFATELLEHFRAQGAEQIILSAYSQNTLEEVVNHYGICPFFDKLIGLDNIYAAGKTENALAHRASLPHENHQILLIGDTLHDLEVARAIGADCILVSHGHHSHERLSATGTPVAESFGTAEAAAAPFHPLFAQLPTRLT